MMFVAPSSRVLADEGPVQGPEASYGLVRSSTLASLRPSPLAAVSRVLAPLDCLYRCFALSRPIASGSRLRVRSDRSWPCIYLIHATKVGKPHKQWLSGQVKRFGKWGAHGSSGP